MLRLTAEVDMPDGRPAALLYVKNQHLFLADESAVQTSSEAFLLLRNYSASWRCSFRGGQEPREQTRGVLAEELQVCVESTSPLTLAMTVPAAPRMSTEFRVRCLPMTALRARKSSAKRSWTSSCRSSMFSVTRDSVRSCHRNSCKLEMRPPPQPIPGHKERR